MSESIALLGPDHTLLGILSEPASEIPTHDLGVVILGAGMVHRAGPHRLHVRLARQLATGGYRVARFDFSGVGDSPVRRDNLPLEQAAISETRHVLEQLSQLWGIRRFVLIGICSGASVAFASMSDDPLIAGSVLVNPPALATSREFGAMLRDQGLSRFYWRQGIRDPRRWWRLLTGKAAYGKILRSLRGLLQQAGGGTREVLQAESSRVLERIDTVADRGGGMLFVFSAGDLGLEQFKLVIGDRYTELNGTGRMRNVVVERADHTFSLQHSQRELLSRIEDWLVELGSNATITATAPPLDDTGGDSDKRYESAP